MAERFFARELGKLTLGAEQEVRGEMILAVTKALLESDVAYVARYQGAPQLAPFKRADRGRAASGKAGRALPQQHQHGGVGPHTAFEDAICRGGVGVEPSLRAFAAGADGAADTLPVPFAPPVPSSWEAGEVLLRDHGGDAYAALYASRLARFAAFDAAGLDEVARQLALTMAYEDPARVAALKIRASRFARVRQEAGAKPGQLVETAEFMHPRLDEMADSLPPPLGRWLLDTGWARTVVSRLTPQGRTVRTSTLRSFLLLYAVAWSARWRPRTLRHALEQAHMEAWLAAVLLAAAHGAPLGVAVARLRELAAGYGGSHARGSARFNSILAVLPALLRRADTAAQVWALHDVALADDGRACLNTVLAAAAAFPALATK